jgi:hypothetical protein
VFCNGSGVGQTTLGTDAGAFVLGGDPASIRESAGRWRAFGIRAEEAGVAIRSVAALSAAEFLGDEGTMYAERLRTEVAAGLTVVADAWNRVGRALTVYAGELEQCQAELRSCWLRTDVPPAELRGAVDAVLGRALKVRSRHDLAQRACCAAIDAAKALAPKPPPRVRGLSGGRRHVLASVGDVPQLVSLRRGLKVAAAASATIAQHPVLAAPTPPEGDPGDGQITPAEGTTEEIHQRIVDVCVLEQGTSVFGNIDTDVEMYWRAIADSAIEDPAIMMQVQARWPMVGSPAPPMPGGWQAIKEYFGFVRDFTVELAGVSDCLEGNAGPCIGEIAMMVFPGGRVAKVGAEAVTGAKDARRLSESGDRAGPTEDRIAKAAGEKAAKDAREVPATEPRGPSDATRAESPPGTPPRAPAKPRHRSVPDGTLVPSEISGSTVHGRDSVLNHDGHGVNDEALADAVANPISPPKWQRDGSIRYQGKDAVVVLTQGGRIITAFAKNHHGWRK